MLDLKRNIIEELYDIQAIKFGQFTLKSGIESPFYVDLRLIISYPDLLKKISDLAWSKASHLKKDLICGVPYTALPIATCLSISHNIPMLMKRKEAKDYGTKKLVEGNFEQGQQCLIIEDIITSGKSIIETVEPLEELGLKVNDVIIILDREQGGTQNVKKHGFFVHSLMTITDVINHLVKAGKLSKETGEATIEFTQTNQVLV